MRLVSIIRATVLATVLVVAFSGIAAASTAPATTYHGTWVSGTRCDGTQPQYTGVWNVNLKNDGTAEVTARIAREGFNTAWGGNYWFEPWIQAQPTPAGDVFALHNDALDLDFVLSENGTLTFTMVGYCEDKSDHSITGEVGR